MTCAIEPLTPVRLEETIALIVRVFLYEPQDDIRLAVASSVDPRLHDQRYKRWRCPWNTYWVAIDGRLKIVVGVTGLYEVADDAAEADWLTWYCVAPEARGQGLGRQLLDYAIDAAKSRGKKLLRLFTSSHPNEAPANALYDRYGFVTTRTERTPGKPYDMIYRELRLE